MNRLKIVGTGLDLSEVEMNGLEIVGTGLDLSEMGRIACAQKSGSSTDSPMEKTDGE